MYQLERILVCELNETDREEARQNAKNVSEEELKQSLVESLKDIQYDAFLGKIQSVEAKLKAACKNLRAWRAKRVIDPLTQ